MIAGRALLILVAVVLPACGQDGGGGAGSTANAASSPKQPIAGGPLADPTWAGGGSHGFGPWGRVGTQFAAGQTALVNRGAEPAVIESVRMIRPRRRGRIAVAGVYAVDHRRIAMGFDDRWPIDRTVVDPAGLTRARGAVVPPKSGPAGGTGVALVYRLKLRGPGTLTWRGTRVRYRVGRQRYVVDVPVTYKMCSARNRAHLRKFGGCLPPTLGQ